MSSPMDVLNDAARLASGDPSGMLEKTVAAASGKIHQYVLGRNPQYKHFVRSVNEHSLGLDELDDTALTARAKELRRSLYAQGLLDELVAQS